MKPLIVLIAALAIVPTAAATDTSMLRQWTPHNRTEMRAADPVALSYVAKAWMLAGDRKRANVIADELERRGTQAFTAGALPNLVDQNQTNPPETVYTIALVQVADAFRATGRTKPLNAALRLLRSMPLVDGGCYPYSLPDVAAGCIQDINGITVAVLSRTRANYIAQLEYAERTMLPDGSWLYWQNAAAGNPMRGRTLEAAHLAWVAFSLVDSPDPRVRALGWRAAGYAMSGLNTDVAPFAFYAVTAIEVLTGTPGGCEHARQLPAWANIYRDAAGSKNQMWAAYVHVWAQSRC